MLRTQWNIGALCIPLAGDPTSRAQRVVIILVTILCTMGVELMFYKNPIFPTIDVCEGRRNVHGLTTNCSAVTIEQQIQECECKTFFSANGCEHCADGPFEGASSRVGARGPIQNCSDFCDEHVPSQLDAVILTTIIVTVLSLLVHQLLDYLHRPFLDMLQVEGTLLREAETAELKMLREKATLDFKGVGTKRAFTKRLSRRLMRVPTELGSLQMDGAEQVDMAAAVQNVHDMDALPPLPRKKVWYTTETGSHIPVAPQMRRQALKKLDDKRKATIIELLLRKSVRYRDDYKRIQKRKKELRAMQLSKLKVVAQKELKRLGKASIDDQGRYVQDMQDALTFVREIPDYSPQLDDLAVHSRSIIAGVYLWILAIGACCGLVIAVHVMNLSAAFTMQWLHGCALSVAIHLAAVEPIRVLVIGHAKRRWYGLHRQKDEQPADELNKDAPDMIKLGGLSEEDQLAKDKEEIERAAECLQKTTTDPDAAERHNQVVALGKESRWASVTTSMTTRTKAASAFKLALSSHSSNRANSTKPAAAEAMISLGPPSSSSAEKLASGIAVAKASRKLAKKKREMAKASLKLATFTQSLTAAQVGIIDNIVEEFHAMKNSHIMEKHVYERQQVDDVDDEQREVLNVKLNVAMSRFDKLVEAFKADAQKVASGEPIFNDLEDPMTHDLSDELVENNLTYDAIMDMYEEAIQKAKNRLGTFVDGSALSVSVEERLIEQKAAMRTKASRLEDLLAKYDQELDDIIENSSTLELDESELLEAGLDPDQHLNTGGEIESTASAPVLDECSVDTLMLPRSPTAPRPTGGTGRSTPTRRIMLESSPLLSRPTGPAGTDGVPDGSTAAAEDLTDGIETVTLLP
jgi:hypothetical protein